MRTSLPRRVQPPEWTDTSFRSLLEAIPDAMLVVDRAGEIVLANLQAEKLFGYDCDELIGRSVEALVPARLRVGHLQHRVNFFGDLRVRPMGAGLELIALRRDGSEVPVEISLSPLTCQAGTFVVSAIRDTTDRCRMEELKKAEAVLREARKSEEQFRTLAEAIPQLCWMARGDGHIFWYNQRWYTYTGTTPEQMEGWGWQSVHDPQTLPHVLERWKTSIATGKPFDMVFPLRGADGVFRPFLTRIMPIKDADGRVVSWFGSNTDITELRDAQEALRISEERLRMGEWAARIGTYEWNVRSGVSIWTPELEALYGLPPGGFGGTRDDFEKLVHPDDRARVADLVDEAIKTGRPTEGEWRVVWPDRTLHWIAARGQVFLNESGEPSRMFGVHLDVTERKRTEEARQQANRILEERTALLQAREKLLNIFVKHVPVAVAMLDRDMRYIQVSERWCADFSVDSAQILGHSHY